jgi:hypothetical protein
MSTQRSFVGTVGSLLALGAVVGVAGCTSGSDPAPRPSGSSPRTTAEPTPTNAPGLPSGVVGATNVPTKVANDVKLRSSVTVTKCAPTADGWAASGIARNRTGEAVSYTITVFFTTPTTTVIGTGSDRVSVKPHGRSSWQVHARFTPAKNTRCVLRGVG